MTDAERKLWGKLRNRQLLGCKFRRQQPIGSYIADFVCQEHRLVVEADGSQHADSESDAVRTALFESLGYRVIRFWNADVLLNIDGVLTVIADALANAPSPTSPKQQAAEASYPLPQGERSADTRSEYPHV